MQRDERMPPAVMLAVAYDPPGNLLTLFGVDETALQQLAALALAGADVEEDAEISLLVTDDDRLRTLNRDYRGRDETTDVLSFPLLDAPLVDAPPEQLWQPPEEEPPRRAAGGLTLELGGEPGMADAGSLAEDGDEADVAGDELLADELLADELLADELLAEETLDDESEAPERIPLYLGDIAIAREAVARQAAQAGHSQGWELAYLVVHGVLHLLGYDDQTDAGYAAMVARQEDILVRGGIAR